MNNFLKIFNENVNSPKAIIMAGAVASGKSTVTRAIQPMVEDFLILNPDTYVEDKDSPMFNNLAASNSQIVKKDLPNAIERKENLIYDTTASNLKTLTPTLDNLKSKGYEIVMIMVYAHPIVSFLRNFKRERKVPAVGVIGTWTNVYLLMGEYKRMFGDRFMLVASPASNQDEADKVKEFTEAYEKGELKQFFMDMINSGNYRSSFQKNDDGISPEELEKREKGREKTLAATEVNIDKLVGAYKQIEDNLDPMDVGDLPRKLGQFI